MGGIAADRDEVLTETLFDKAHDAALGEIVILKNNCVLNLGCSGGLMRKILSKYNRREFYLDGVDNNPQLARKARKKLNEAKKGHHRLSLKCQDYFNYLETCEEGRYDAAIASLVLSQVENSKFFHLVNKVMKSGGRFVILKNSKSHLRELEKAFFEFAASNPHLFELRSFSQIVLHETFSYVLPVNETIKLLREAEFSKVKRRGKPVFSNLHFENSLHFTRWLYESGLAARYISFVKKDKKEIFCREAAEFLIDNEVKIVGEVIGREKPFKLTLPVYIITAEKK